MNSVFFVFKNKTNQNVLHKSFMTCQISLLAEDLDRTLEAPGERMSPKGDTNPQPCAKEVE